MPSLRLLFNLTDKDKAGALQNLIDRSAPSDDFFLMMILSIFMATFGLMIDSATIIIGSMLLAPVLYPILSLSMGIILADYKLVKRSFITITKSVFLGVAAAMLATIFFFKQSEAPVGLISTFTDQPLIYAAVAAIAGLAGSFAMVKPKLNATLPGVAISVALVPPLAVVGMGFALLDAVLVVDALTIFAINILGILFTSMIVFASMNFYVKKQVAVQAVKKEEKTFKKEEQKALKEKEKEEKIIGQ
jgi:uncharacterized hydrophobic protein (TIGR00271 family)